MEGNVRYSILIVDDETSNLAVLNKILSPEFTVRTAKTGEECLKRAAEAIPDLILLDIILPGISGFDVLERIKASAVLRNIPVIIISGLSGENDEERGFVLGAVDYITKPFRSSIVMARVRTHIGIVDYMKTIEKLSLVDPLTNIPNRRAFDSRLELEWRRCMRERKPLSLLMIDVDKFKQFNDTYGHPNGDELLKVIAGIFNSVTRRPADIAARIGGEEFCILLPDATRTGTAAIAEKIRSQVEHTRVELPECGKVSVTVSIGAVTELPGEGRRALEMMAKADKRLYEAKHLGRNVVRYE
ncbi:MAG: diguanylate cyclase [Clostridiales Family XIII bacterium]|nr:diguanylate cyclase [Clostridiales Family XIII bacterium]